MKDNVGTSGAVPTAIAGFTKGWDAIEPDSSGEATPGTGDAFAWNNMGVTSGDVTYGPVCNDTVDPVTTIALSGASTGSKSTSAVTVSLKATDPGSLASAPTGTVAFKLGAQTQGSVTLSGGKSKYTTKTLPAGTDTLTAVYGGDTGDLGSTSAALKQTVDKATTKTSLVSSPNPAAPARRSSTSPCGPRDRLRQHDALRFAKTRLQSFALLFTSGRSTDACISLDF